MNEHLDAATFTKDINNLHYNQTDKHLKDIHGSFLLATILTYFKSYVCDATEIDSNKGPLPGNVFLN